LPTEKTKAGNTDVVSCKDVYAEWKKSGYSAPFQAEHEEQIIIHKAAKKAFDALGGKIPKIKDLNAEYNMVLAQKQKDYADYRESRNQMRDLLTVKANIDTVSERKDRDREIVR
jgi:hypothetical protein